MLYSAAWSVDDPLKLIGSLLSQLATAYSHGQGDSFRILSFCAFLPMGTYEVSSLGLYRLMLKSPLFVDLDHVASILS